MARVRKRRLYNRMILLLLEYAFPSFKETYGRVEAKFNYFVDQRREIILSVCESVVYTNNDACLAQSTERKTIWWRSTR
jgi:hypothetical protein